MSDRIILSRLAVHAHHGVHAEEERLGQRFLISVTCTLDLRPAGLADDYAQSVCYGEVAALVNEIATGRRFRIIEALAEAIAGALLTAFPRLEAVRVLVEKPAAPIPLILAQVAVEIERRRDG